MIIVTALLFGAGGAALIGASFDSAVTSEENAAAEGCALILGMLQMVGDQAGYLEEADLRASLQVFGERGEFDALLLQRAADRGVIYAKGYQGIFLEAPETGRGVIRTAFRENGGSTYILTGTLLELGSTPYTLYLARNLRPVFELRREQISLFVRVYVILLLAAVAISYLTATYLTRPLLRLSRASKEIASGNLSYRSGIRTDDEVGTLSRDFDHMAEQMEENVLHLREEAENRERFMGAFTHELKTPMTSIIGYADLIRSQALSKEEEADALQYIFSEGKRLENMSLKLLDLFVADKAELRLLPASPASIAGDVTVHLRPVLEKAGITAALEAEEGKCLLEPDLTRTLLINLLDNARKAMPDGGRIGLFVRMTPDGVLFIVRDSGRGMEQEELRHITEAFYRVDKARARAEGSAGLGLALCAKIVELHKGSLRFESEPGKGTTVFAEFKGGRA